MSGSATFRLAVGQAQWTPDRRDLVARAAALVEEAAGQRAELLVLSETFLFGYRPEALAAPAARDELLSGPGDPRLRPLVEACARTGVRLLIGASLVPGEIGGRARNALLEITGAGVHEVYRKMHLWSTERTVIEPGQKLSALDHGGRRIGLGICYDAGFPEFVRAYAQAGVQAMVFSSAFAVGDERRRYDMYHAARALESGVWVAVSNALGTIDGVEYFGRSAIFDPRGVLVAELGDRPGVAAADISSEAIRLSRAEFGYLDALRTDYRV